MLSNLQDSKCWECDVCRKTFTTKYFLRKHKRLHTGDYSYSSLFAKCSSPTKNLNSLYQAHHFKPFRHAFMFFPSCPEFLPKLWTKSNQNCEYHDNEQQWWPAFKLSLDPKNHTVNCDHSDCKVLVIGTISELNNINIFMLDTHFL